VILLTKKLFFSAPPGALDPSIPHAAIAAAYTSKDIVTPTHRDAQYFRALERHGILLNEPQIKAVRHGEGPFLTLAGAGSGKTSVLVCRTGYLLAVRQVNPRSLLLLTFSTKAAAEMRDRIAQLPGVDPRTAELIQARTFHSFFLQFIRRQGVTEDIFSEVFKQHLVLKQLMRSMGLQDVYQPETLLSLLSSYKMNLIEVADLPARTAEEKELKQLFGRYEQWKSDNRKMDFDDVLLIAHRLLTADSNLLRSLQNRYLYVMNDEFQDTNYLQYELVKMIVGQHQNLMVVGDDDQTIYSFNGARSEFILHFEKTYPKAQTITLDINYRSSPSIVGLGNEVIRHNTQRRAKTLKAANQSTLQPQYLRPFKTDDEAETILHYIAHEVREGRRNYGDFAILYRSGSNNRAILEQLVLQDIPYSDHGDGQLLYDHWLIKPLIGHMRLSFNRRDFDAIETILPSLYINREKGMAHIVRQEARQPKKGPLIHLLAYPDMKDFQQEKIKDRLAFIRSMPEMKPLEAITQMRKRFYDSFMETNERHPLTKHKEDLKETLDELQTSAERFDTIESFLSFIDEVAYKSKTAANHKLQEQGDRIALMTIHRSKGLEFPVVFLIGASEGSLPHSSAIEADRLSDAQHKGNNGSKSAAAIEEERRLAYVAITRAREELIISSPSQYRGKKAAISRFILSVFTKTAAATAIAEPARTPLAKAGQRHSPARPTRTETVAAWLCTSSRCTAWVRIGASKPTPKLSKECPLCKAPMSRGSREVPV
jgi:DNA helicase-2/ATP-dependent DNA helicase PcrA